MLYAFIVCFFFVLTIGSFAFVSRADTLCPTYMKNGTSGLCYIAIGAGAAGIAGVLWPFLPTPMHTYISLMATMPSGDVFNIQMAIATYVELMRALRHMQKLTIVPLDVAECVKEETAYSVQLVRQSMFSESHVDGMNRGISEVADSFNKIQRVQDAFRDAIERGFRWLEGKGGKCRTVLEQPYIKCLNESTNGLHEKFVCGPMKLLASAACDKFSQERVTEFLLAIRDRIALWISSAVRMRVGILLELHSTGYVAEELANAWAPFKAVLNAGSTLVTFLYSFITLYVLKYMGFVVLIVWPFYYIIWYNRGPLDYDNKYIPQEEENKEMRRANEETPDEIRYLPLQLGAEVSAYQMIRCWIPTPEEISRLVASLIFVADLIIILAILVADFYYTKLVDGIYFGSIQMFNRYQGNIFSINRAPYATGIRYIGQIILEQLDRLQQAAGFGRMVACARPAPPIDYTYEVFIMAFCFRIFYLFSRIMLAWIPSTICARFNRQRHKQRLRSIKAKILLRREGYEAPSYCPWLRTCFASFASFCSLSHLTPRWLRHLLNMKETVNF